MSLNMRSDREEIKREIIEQLKTEFGAERKKADEACNLKVTECQEKLDKKPWMIIQTNITVPFKLFSKPLELDLGLGVCTC